MKLLFTIYSEILNLDVMIKMSLNFFNSNNDRCLKMDDRIVKDELNLKILSYKFKHHFFS